MQEATDAVNREIETKRLCLEAEKAKNRIEGEMSQSAAKEREAEPKAESCVTPHRRPGECVLLTKCPSLLRLLKRPVPPKVIQLLRQSVCEFQGRMPVVCCPVTAKVNPVLM